MNAYEYLQALRAALAVLPDDEIESAMRYYEDYFLDAGDENAAEVIEQLGPPEQVAQAILSTYTGMARRRPEHFDEEKPIDGVPLGTDGRPIRKKGIEPWMLLVLGLLVVVLGPVVLGVLVAVIAAVFAIALALAVCLIALPAAAVIAGIVLTVFSFLLWAIPASALATLGFGFILLAGGLLAGVLAVKLFLLLVPPFVRGVVRLVRWLIYKLRDLLKGGVSR